MFGVTSGLITSLCWQYMGISKISHIWANTNWAASSEFVSSSIPSWQISTAHAQPFRGARDLAFCLKVPFDLLLVWASSGGSGETARMRRLAWTFAARMGDKYQIRLTRPNWSLLLKFNDVNNQQLITGHWILNRYDVTVLYRTISNLGIIQLAELSHL